MDNRSGKSKLDLIVKTYDLLSFQHVAEAALKNEAIKLICDHFQIDDNIAITESYIRLTEHRYC